VVTFVVIIKYAPRLLGAPASLDLSAVTRDPVYLASFVAYFFLGYLLFAALLVMIGAVCNTLKEAQNLMGPITILLIVPLMAMVPIGRDPNGTLAKVLSFIPPFTPFVMMNRAAGPPALWEYVATTALLVVSIGIALWAAAKVFRIGVLLTGKPPKPSEILRWIRAPVGTVAVRRE
jgi:ABC-type Na+ efflux pump permease subunit